MILNRFCTNRFGKVGFFMKSITALRFDRSKDRGQDRHVLFIVKFVLFLKDERQHYCLFRFLPMQRGSYITAHNRPPYLTQEKETEDTAEKNTYMILLTKNS